MPIAAVALDADHLRTSWAVGGFWAVAIGFATQLRKLSVMRSETGRMPNRPSSGSGNTPSGAYFYLRMP